MSRPIGQLSALILNASDMDKACDFYTGVLGLPLKFRDGDRWAALDAGGLTIALAGQSERLPQNVALSFKVIDIEAAVEEVIAKGGRVDSAIATGEHERRVSMRDNEGNLLYLYSPLSKS